MVAGLSPADVVNVQINLAPLAVPMRNFGALLIIGATNIITPTERLRPYTTITAIADDFALTDPEYLAAAAFFAQSPQPSIVYIGRKDTGETPLQAVQACASASNDWYGCLVTGTVTDQQHQDIAAYIEAASPSRIYGITTQVANTKEAATTTDLASVLADARYMRTFIQYSSASPYAAASLFGRAFTVDFGANNTTITLKFKQEPSITAETISEAQAIALRDKHCNVFVNYSNDAAIIQEGVMANGYFFDEVHNADWFANALQVAVWNRLYTSTTKIPQTDEGVHLLVTSAETVCVQAVANGMLAPGVWGGPNIGALRSGDTLAKGYYVYAPTIASQLQADREARRAPTMQIAAKLAGAVHFANVIVNVNR